MATCNPGGDCIAFIDAKKRGYLDPKWSDHVLAHGRGAEDDEDEVRGAVDRRDGGGDGPSEMTDLIADMFDIPRDVAHQWEREGLEKRLHRQLWRLLIRKHMVEIAARGAAG